MNQQVVFLARGTPKFSASCLILLERLSLWADKRNSLQLVTYSFFGDAKDDEIVRQTCVEYGFQASVFNENAFPIVIPLGEFRFEDALTSLPSEVTAAAFFIDETDVDSLGKFSWIISSPSPPRENFRLSRTLGKESCSLHTAKLERREVLTSLTDEFLAMLTLSPPVGGEFSVPTRNFENDAVVVFGGQGQGNWLSSYQVYRNKTSGDFAGLTPQKWCAFAEKTVKEQLWSWLEDKKLSVEVTEPCEKVFQFLEIFPASADHEVLAMLSWPLIFVSQICALCSLVPFLGASTNYATTGFSLGVFGAGLLSSHCPDNPEKTRESFIRCVRTLLAIGVAIVKRHVTWVDRTHSEFAMCSISGLAVTHVEELVQAFRLEIVIVTSADRVVVGGPVSEIERLQLRVHRHFGGRGRFQILPNTYGLSFHHSVVCGVSADPLVFETTNWRFFVETPILLPPRYSNLGVRSVRVAGVNERLDAAQLSREAVEIPFDWRPIVFQIAERSLMVSDFFLLDAGPTPGGIGAFCARQAHIPTFLEASAECGASVLPSIVKPPNFSRDKNESENDVGDLSVEERIRKVLSSCGIELDANDWTLNITSIRAVQAVRALEGEFILPRNCLPDSMLFADRSISKMVQRVTGNHSMSKITSSPLPRQPCIIRGVGWRVPGSSVSDLHSFWDLLCERDAVHLGVLRDGIWPGGVIHGAELLDCELFGISRAEASEMDPQQRILLEVVLNALENSQLNVEEIKKRGLRTGVFVGAFLSDAGLCAANVRAASNRTPNPLLGTCTSESALAGRISFSFDFVGPTVTINTACSSGLVALHAAHLSLAAGECDIAVVAGVNVILDSALSEAFSESGMLAPDGLCKTFAKNADGYVRSEACVAVILTSAMISKHSDGRSLPGLATVKGTASNNDGRTSSFTHPSKDAQRNVIIDALAVAQIEAKDVSYVECHGTGTRIGDALELEALAEIYGTPSDSILVGSAKRIFGHTEAAAGLVGLIKVLAGMTKQVIPGMSESVLQQESSLNVTPVCGLHPWPETNDGVLAGISSFGFTGTNVHVIVESMKQGKELAASSDQLVIFPIVSYHAELLQDTSRAWAHALKKTPWLSSDFAIAASRRGGAARSFVVSSETQLTVKLSEWAPAGLCPSFLPPLLFAKLTPPRVAFLFTGQGSERHGMGRLLFSRFQAFRSAALLCLRGFETCIRSDLTTLFVEAESHVPIPSELKQPLLFVFEYALAHLWLSVGIVPELVGGHSFGEYLAACISGLMPLEDAIRVVTLRGALMAGVSGGVMFSVRGSESEIRSVLSQFACSREEFVVISAVNATHQVVLSGTQALMEKVVQLLTESGKTVRKLPVHAAFHSPAMESVAKDLELELDRVRWNLPRIHLMSNVHGRVLPPREALELMGNSAYWKNHLVGPVLFAESAQSACSSSSETHFVEIGPRPVLSALQLGACTKSQFKPHCVCHVTCTGRNSEVEDFLTAAGNLWSAGCEISFPALAAERDGSENSVDCMSAWCPPSPQVLHRAPFPVPTTSAEVVYEQTWVEQAVERTSLTLSDRDLPVALHDGVVSKDRLDTVRAAFRSEYTFITCAWFDFEDQAEEIFQRETQKLLTEFRGAVVDERGPIVVICQNPKSGASDLQTLLTGVLSGLIKSAAAEYLNLRVLFLLLDSFVSSGDLADVILAWESRKDFGSESIVVAEVARDAKSALIRLPQLHPAQQIAENAKPLQGTILVTGGAGALGTALCRHLVKFYGTRSLLIAGRSETIDAHAAATFRKLAEVFGVRWKYVSGDVSSRTFVRKLLKTRCSEPIKGIFHLAGILEVANIDTKECPDAMARCVKAKATSALLLHQISQQLELPLDVFAVSSSVSSTFGGRGSAPYACSNAAISFLMEHRRSIGICGSSVELGPISSVGMAHRSGEKLSRYLNDEFGMDYMNVERAVQILILHALFGKQAVVMAANFNPLVLCDHFPYFRGLLCSDPSRSRRPKSRLESNYHSSNHQSAAEEPSVFEASRAQVHEMLSSVLEEHQLALPEWETIHLNGHTLGVEAASQLKEHIEEFSGKELRHNWREFLRSPLHVVIYCMQSRLSKSIVYVLHDLLGLDNLQDDSNFRVSGLDSLTERVFVSRLAKLEGGSLQEIDLQEVNTAWELASLVILNSVSHLLSSKLELAGSEVSGNELSAESSFQSVGLDSLAFPVLRQKLGPPWSSLVTVADLVSAQSPHDLARDLVGRLQGEILAVPENRAQQRQEKLPSAMIEVSPLTNSIPFDFNPLPRVLEATNSTSRVANDLVEKNDPEQMPKTAAPVAILPMESDALQFPTSQGEFEELISPLASIARDCFVGKRVRIGPFVVIESGCEIGESAIIESHCLIRRNSKVGDGCVVEAATILGPDVQIGRGCVLRNHSSIVDGANIGADNIVGHHSTILRGTVVGNGNNIQSFVAIGGAPQDKASPVPSGPVIIGDDNFIGDHTNIHAPHEPDNAVTKIGTRCFIMSSVHVPHDCVIDSEAILGVGVVLGGHTRVMHNAFLGLNSTTHQFCTIGAHSMIALGTSVTVDVAPFTIFSTRSVQVGRSESLNVIGLQRAGMADETIDQLQSYYSSLGPSPAVLARQGHRAANWWEKELSEFDSIRAALGPRRRALGILHTEGFLVSL